MPSGGRIFEIFCLITCSQFTYLLNVYQSCLELCPLGLLMMTFAFIQALEESILNGKMHALDSLCIFQLFQNRFQNIQELCHRVTLTHLILTFLGGSLFTIPFLVEAYLPCQRLNVLALQLSKTLYSASCLFSLLFNQVCLDCESLHCESFIFQLPGFWLEKNQEQLKLGSLSGVSGALISCDQGHSGHFTGTSL